MKEILKKFLERSLDVIFPKKCVGCSVLGTSLCQVCLDTLPSAQWNTETPSYIDALFDYQDDVVKRIIWSLKYKGDREIIQKCAEVLYAHLVERLSELMLWDNKETILLVPIPMYKKRKRERGFNQSELLIHALSKFDHNALFTLRIDLIKKHKETPSQISQKSREKRIKNIIGSFLATRQECIHGKIVIVIDDVWTTGATIKEARRVLLKAGAKKVLACTVAH